MPSINIDRPLSICYDSWTDDITIEGRRIRHVQTRYEYDNPVSGVPSRQYAVELLDTELTKEQLAEANEYVKLLQEHNVRISMAEVRQAWQNGYAERLMRTIKRSKSVV
jgi:hypothetical protein